MDAIMDSTRLDADDGDEKLLYRRSVGRSVVSRKKTTWVLLVSILMAQWSGQPALHCSKTDANEWIVLGWMDHGWMQPPHATPSPPSLPLPLPLPFSLGT